MVQDWREKAQSPADVIGHVRSGTRVFIQGAAATPAPLLEALTARTDLEQVQLYHLHLSDAASIASGRDGWAYLRTLCLRGLLSAVR